MKILLPVLLLLPALVFAQKRNYTIADLPSQIDSATGGTMYRGIVQVPGVSADELYSRAKLFMTKNLAPKPRLSRLTIRPAGYLLAKKL